MERSSILMALLPILLLALAASSRTNYSAPAAAQHDPRKLIILQLRGRDRDKASLAVQAHDLSLAGFANRTNHWHAFPGYEDVIPNATILPFGNSYRNLVGGLENLLSLPLGRDPAVHAIHALSGHNPAAADDDKVVALKRGLATLTVTNCEALRLTPIKEIVSSGWESGDAQLTTEHLGYIEHWDTICYELNRADKNGVWDGPFTELLREHTNIKSKEEARGVVGVIAKRTLQEVLMAHARRT